MSMNLHCKEVDLWQTPTHITYMCYSDNDGGWEGIRYRYIAWVKGHLDGAWKDLEDLRELRGRIDRHGEELYKHTHLTFSIT
jgi:hypothetical protein